MKIVPICLCVGVALLGSGACGNAENDWRGAGGASSGAPPSTNSGSGGDSGARDSAGDAGSGNNGGTGSQAGSGATTNDAGTAGMELGGAPSETGPRQCTPGDTTTVSGVVLDPAGANPLYNVLVYVLDPSSPLPDLSSMPVGCGCTQLLPAKVLAKSAPTDASGHFEIPCAPSGTVSLVVQTGKWRRQYDGVEVKLNQRNVVPNLRLPANSNEGSLPNIAISTGGNDSFECLPLRMGVSASEYVAGSASDGHIHIYTGRRGATPAQGAVESKSALWDSQAHLNEHDLVILSCEGEETTGGATGTRVNATAQQYLQNYANSGGRVLATHYQYAWFNTGPFATGPNSLATWTAGGGLVDDTQSFPGELAPPLSSGAAFPAGAAFAQWLKLVGVLVGNQMPLWFPHSNVTALNQPPSREWLRLSASSPQAPSAPQLFTADMPVGATGSAVCGRVAYSSLHVTGGPNMNAPGVPVDYPPATGGSGSGGGTGFPGFPPTGQAQGGIVPLGCARRPLTPQEAALEFMFFDLSSCLVPIADEPGQP